MFAPPEKMEEQIGDTLARIWTEHLVALAVQLAAQEGKVLDRPVPAEWLDRAFEVHNKEFDHTTCRLLRFWSDQEAERAAKIAPPPG